MIFVLQLFFFSPSSLFPAISLFLMTDPSFDPLFCLLYYYDTHSIISFIYTHLSQTGEEKERMKEIPNSAFAFVFDPKCSLPSAVCSFRTNTPHTQTLTHLTSFFLSELSSHVVTTVRTNDRVSGNRRCNSMGSLSGTSEGQWL